MKPMPLALAALLASLSSARSQEPPAPAHASILGGVADGTAAPEPAEPGFLVPTKDILDRKTIAQDGREIVIQRIAPIRLPPRPAQGPPVDVTAPAFQQQIAGFRGENPDTGLLFVGATVFRPKDSPPRTLVSLWPQGQGQPVTFWSSADFALLSGFSSFTGSDGIVRSLMMAWDTREIEHADDPGTPEIPNLPPGKATFAITSVPPAAEVLASIQSLHDLYNNEYDRLKTAFEARENARLALEAEQKAHPPKPKDIILNYWRTERPAPTASQEGGAR